ncbi:Lethal(2) giant larvae protein -like protein SRO77 [Escovopsis weberi]|uniref:Lethal(2) giant larvae protein-like protein SRO77 n=1 Tax=Escovopsis weberi TaxID=150374 RepID=A0A0N0RT19_ESCWE|nr:Lethal(2) giant larvae protein -like protein SRO77 [Escovopsis weberi]
MAGFLRGKQAGIQNDLSASIRPEFFAPDDQARHGIGSQISCFAYDPVQSLLAIGTSESKFGPGRVYVFGKERVQKMLEPPRRSTFRSLHFSLGRLVTLDAKNELGVWDLDTGARVAAQVIGGPVACVVTDPMLDWAFVGLQNGDVMAYDIDRHGLARAFRLPNFWKDKNPSARDSRLITMALHPRDVGKMLIGYSHGVVIYSFKQNKATQFLEYVLPQGAPGGSGLGMDAVRQPRLTHAVWHPSGTFIVSAHEDGSLVFWDPKEGKVTLARTLSEMGIDHPTPSAPNPGRTDPCIKLAWCCKENCDDTGLLVAGGQSHTASPKSLTFIEFGLTPMYATSTWQALSDHFRGKRHIPLVLPPGAQVLDFLTIPRESPHFAGAQDPIAVLVLLTSGELITMSFPSGYSISPTNQLHPSMFFVHPFITRINITSMERTRWLSMEEKRDRGEAILKGGAEGPRPKKRFEERTIIQAAHGDSTIRIWDSGHADEIENRHQVQVDIARALDRQDDVEVTAMSMAGSTGEFAAGTRTGELIVYRWGGNRFYGNREPRQLDPNPMGLSDISSRAEPNLRDGLQPFVLYEMMQGPITAAQISNIGFVAVGSELGFLSLIDLRGPKIIHQSLIAELGKQEHRINFLKGHSRASSNPLKEWPTVIEFGVMTLDEDKYSSICCFVGTNLGKVITLKLLPQNGSYEAQVAGVVAFEGRVLSLNPIEVDTGKPAAATGTVVAGLREGRQVNGAVVAVTSQELRIFKPAQSKGASKDFDDAVCHAASVAELEMQGFAVVGVFSDKTARAFSIPGMRDLGKAPLPTVDTNRLAQSVVTQTGDIFAWTGPSELAMVHVWGTGKGLEQSTDRLVNPKLAYPPRPVISNMQWISGTQYVSPVDLDLLVGGADRPPSKRMMEAAAAEQRAAQGGGGGAAAGPSSEGWGDYLTRQLNERTEKLNMMGDNLGELQEQSAGWAEDVHKFIGKQKRNIVLGSIKSKFF